MRLVGAGWLTVWADLSVAVLVPVVLAMLLTTMVVSVASSSLLAWLSSSAIPRHLGLTVLGNGLRLTAAAVIVSVGLSQVGLVAVRRL
ncbi:MAG: hypothetical protein WAN34_13620 [Acidimicrobiia bacterium]